MGTYIFNVLKANALYAFTSLISLGLIYIGNAFRKAESVIADQKQEIKGCHRRLTGPRFNFPIQGNERHNRVMVLGLGGTGKSNLVKALSKHPELDPRVPTGDVHTFSIVHEALGHKKSNITRIDFDDYRGQSLGMLTGLQHQRVKDANIFPVTSVLMVVDLYEDLNVPAFNKVRAQPNAARVAKHIEAWNDNSIDLILGPIRKDLKYFCLFINKCDLCGVTLPDLEKIVLKEYAPLIDKIENRARGWFFQVIVGSALAGIGTDPLMTELICMSQLYEDGEHYESLA